MTGQIEWRSCFQQEPIEQDVYFKFVCFYEAMTELYDRGLTNMRSRYDRTEAYITGEARKWSNWYSLKLYECITEYIRKKTKAPFDIARWKKQTGKRYSAQGWINEFERLKRENDEIILDMVENVCVCENKRKETGHELEKPIIMKCPF